MGSNALILHFFSIKQLLCCAVPKTGSKLYESGEMRRRLSRYSKQFILCVDEYWKQTVKPLLLSKKFNAAFRENIPLFFSVLGYAFVPNHTLKILHL